MKLTLSILLASCALTALPVMASESGADLAKKNNCMNCHGVDKKIVGPALKDIAKKYKGNTEAVALLSKKVKDGGSGVWGPIPMSPNKAVSDADIKVMVEYVLALN
jgi:cytochrome c